MRVVRRHEGIGRVWRFVAALALVGLLAGLPSSSATAEEGAEVPADVAGLLDAFRLGDEPADFVVVVDLSGSMSGGPNPPYPSVKAAYASFIEAVGPNDFVSVVTFSGRANLKWNGPVPDAAARAKVISQLPDVATEKDTDIGLALSTVVDRLERPDANAVQVVVFLTDGGHNPTSGSPFPTTSGPAWDGLRKRVEAIEGTHNIIALGAGVGTSATGIDLLGSVFPDAQVSSLPDSQLPGFFTESIQRARLAQLDPLVRTELTDGALIVRVPDPPSLSVDRTIDVELASGYPHLPVDVDLRKVQVRTEDGTALRAELVDGPASFSLPPGGTTTVPVRVRGLPVDHSHDRSVGSFTEREQLVIDVDATITPQPDKLLGLLFGDLGPGKGAVDGKVVLARESGITYLDIATWIALLLLAAAVLYALWWNFVQIPPLIGLIEVRESKEEIPLKGKTMTFPGRRMVLPAGTAGSFELFTKRARRKKVFIRALKQPVETKPRAAYQPLVEPTQLLFNQVVRLGTTELKYRIASAEKAE